MDKSATIYNLLVEARSSAARVCGSLNSTSPRNYQYNLLELRWDSADPSKQDQFATISASLSDSTYPLYECNVEWPESWAGWYMGGTNIIWSDCIWTGAGAGKDKTVSFAVDWKSKTMYLSHTFACSDRSGSDGLATGFLTLDLDCRNNTITEGTSYCTPKTTSTGSRPSLSFNTTLAPAPLVSTAKCTDNKNRYQSWRLEKWLRQCQAPPASEIPGTTSTPSSDTGPSFTLTSMANNEVLNCTTSGKQSNVFKGDCMPAAAGGSSSATQVGFEFDPALNILTVHEYFDCGSESSFDAVGIAYMQAACSRDYNSDVFTCTSDPVWVGTDTV
ncbi:hypothetical protein CONLIGDRAFT_659839 [Coniochaeta ligniaria NRRL 30616]|uniref:Uncharacterized protein n=1 Tax=Coniochaeta ligniaria NRRL 30616 TaxID=1408157 RepID=A0A1J7JXL6_9PEZI|nr:hypothetical protein CONLIGDRAFT_659839 [Coniochaeta ligniaria NRRL 30616]